MIEGKTKEIIGSRSLRLLLALGFAALFIRTAVLIYKHFAGHSEFHLFDASDFQIFRFWSEEVVVIVGSALTSFGLFLKKRWTLWPFICLFLMFEVEIAGAIIQGLTSEQVKNTVWELGLITLSIVVPTAVVIYLIYLRNAIPRRTAGSPAR